MDRIRFSIVDDHPVVLMGIQMLMKSKEINHIQLCGSYSSGTEALHDISNTMVDVVLVDMLMPDINGPELICHLLEAEPRLKIAIYSSFEDRAMIIEAFANGALGYLSKSADSLDFINFIETIAKGEQYIRGDIAKILYSATKQKTTARKLVMLTPREKEVLELMVDGARNKAIADKLFISERTVEFHKKNIYSKFEVTNLMGLVKIMPKHNHFAKMLNF